MTKAGASQRKNRRWNYSSPQAGSAFQQQSRGTILASFPRQRTMRFNRQIANAVLATSVSAESTYGFAYTFSAILNSSEFTGLFDQYRFVSIHITLIPAYTIAQTGVTTNLGGFMVVVPDYDDAVASSISTLMQYSTKKIYPLNRMVNLVLPDLRTKVGASGATAGNAVSSRADWFDIADSDQPFYGLKLAFTQTTIVQTFNMVADATFEVRGDR